MEINKAFKEVLNRLSPQEQQELLDFARFLLNKKSPQEQNKMTLNWAGGLEKYRDQYTSLELQKKALDWFGD